MKVSIAIHFILPYVNKYLCRVNIRRKPKSFPVLRDAAAFPIRDDRSLSIIPRAEVAAKVRSPAYLRGAQVFQGAFDVSVGGRKQMKYVADF